MATWRVARANRVCALTGKPLGPGSTVVTALFGADEEVGEDKVRGTGLARKDFLVDGADPKALEAALSGCFCSWRTKVPPETGPKALRLDLGMARELLERLVAANDPARAPAALVLALLLARKRRVTVVAEKDSALVLRWPKEESTFSVPVVPVTEAEEESLQQELLRLFEV
jgi:hypothetical protein